MERAQELWQQQHGAVAPRAQLVAGDMFESVPPADVYFLKHIIHDWDDAPSIKILQAIRRCAAPGARVLLCETVVPDAAAPSWMARMDLLVRPRFGCLVVTPARLLVSALQPMLWSAAGTPQ